MAEPYTVPPPEPIPEAPEVQEAQEGSVLPLVRLLPPPPEGAILVPPEYREPPRRRWFIVELWAELRLAAQMYFDPRYRVSRTAQLAFPLFFLLLAVNYLVFGLWISIPVVSPVAERVLDVVLAVLAYRVLTRELDRYRAVLDYLARYAQR